MTEKQELKLQLLKEFAISTEPESVDFCRKAYEFLAENEATPQAGAIAAQQEPDGVYLVFDGGKHVLFTGKNNVDDCKRCIGIGVKWGRKSVMVALHDEADGEEIILSANKDTTKYGGYINAYLDAVADWNGKTNTKHLKEIGLNGKIALPDGWYIPSLGELYFVFLNRRAINAALEFVGGKRIDNYWYWTSTEYSVTNAWYLRLGIGYVFNTSKTSYTCRVRAVSAFIS